MTEKDPPAPEWEYQLVMNKEYQHKPLPASGHIRLLLLRRKEYREEVQCELRDYPLDTCPLYTAVSYTWDDSESSRMYGSGRVWHQYIIIDRARFPVRRNLSYLLEHVRQAGEDRLLWIDAICIDQKNTEERNEQVRLMGQIYFHANEVLAWLGHDGAMASAFQLILSLAFLDKDRRNKMDFHIPTHDELFKDKFGDDESDRDMDDDLKEALGEFCNLAFWTRRWIIQEIVIAERVVLQYGLDRITLSAVEQVLVKSESNGLDKRTDSLYATFKRSRPGLLCQHRVSIQRKSEPSYLLQLMRRYRYFYCAEPRDKVYSMVNLMGQTREHLRIDYNIGLDEFFVDIFCFMNQFESTPHYDVVGVGVVLQNALKFGEALVSPTMKAILDQKEAVNNMTVWFFARGTVVRRLSPQAAQDVEYYRQQVAGLADLTPTRLHIQDKALLIAPITAARSYGASVHIVSSQELCSFTCRCGGPRAGSLRELIGLASCRVKDGDGVWQFHDTEVAFIVRCDSDGYLIVGRAYLVPQRTAFELEHFPSTEKSREGLYYHIVQLTSASLLDLVFWASPRTTV